MKVVIVGTDVAAVNEVGFIPAENPESGMRINKDGNKEWFLEVGTLLIPEDEVPTTELDTCTAGYCQIAEEEKEIFDAITPDDIITDKELEEEVVSAKPKKKKKRSRKKKGN